MNLARCLPCFLILGVASLSGLRAQVPVPADPVPPQQIPSGGVPTYEPPQQGQGNNAPPAYTPPSYSAPTYSTPSEPPAQNYQQPSNPSTGAQGNGQNSGKNRQEGAGGKRPMLRIMMQLDLSQDQKEQMRQIMQSDADRQEKRKQVMALLTPEQKQQLRRLVQEARARGELGPAGQGQGGGGAQETGAASRYNGNPSPESAPSAPQNPQFTPYDPKPVGPLNL